MGLALALFGIPSFLPLSSGFPRAFLIAMVIFVGAVAGRIIASVWAGKKISSITSLLYQKADPEDFIQKFNPILEHTPSNTIEYVDGTIKMAYACEALGRFDEGLKLLEKLKPGELHLHALAGTALTENQKLRLYLLKEDTEAARTQIDTLQGLWETATGRAPSLASNVKECIRLAENWLNALTGQPVDQAYLEEEIKLAGNDIHRSEMQLLLAKAMIFENKTQEAKHLLSEAKRTGKGLYAETAAEELLGDLS